MEPAPGAPDLSLPILDRVILPNAQPGETQDKHEEPDNPVSLCDYLVPPEEHLDRSALEAFLAGEAGPRTIEMRAFKFDCFIVIIGEAIRASMGMVKGIPVLRHPV